MSIQLGLALLLWRTHPICSLIHAIALFSDGLSACFRILLPEYLSLSSSLTSDTKYLISGITALFLPICRKYSGGHQGARSPCQTILDHLAVEAEQPQMPPDTILVHLPRMDLWYHNQCTGEFHLLYNGRSMSNEHVVLLSPLMFE